MPLNRGFCIRRVTTLPNCYKAQEEGNPKVAPSQRARRRPLEGLLKGRGVLFL